MTSIIFTAESHSIAYVYHIFTVHLSVEGHLAGFPLVAFMSRAAKNMGEQISVKWYVESYECTRNGTSGSCARFIYLVEFFFLFN